MLAEAGELKLKARRLELDADSLREGESLTDEDFHRARETIVGVKATIDHKECAFKWLIENPKGTLAKACELLENGTMSGMQGVKVLLTSKSLSKFFARKDTGQKIKEGKKLRLADENLAILEHYEAYKEAVRNFNDTRGHNQAALAPSLRQFIISAAAESRVSRSRSFIYNVFRRARLEGAADLPRRLTDFQDETLAILEYYEAYKTAQRNFNDTRGHNQAAREPSLKEFSISAAADARISRSQIAIYNVLWRKECKTGMPRRRKVSARLLLIFVYLHHHHHHHHHQATESTPPPVDSPRRNQRRRGTYTDQPIPGIVKDEPMSPMSGPVHQRHSQACPVVAESPKKKNKKRKGASRTFAIKEEEGSDGFVAAAAGDDEPRKIRRL